MEKKNDMNVVVAIIICVALLAVLIFISINKKVSMDSNDIVASTSGVVSGEDVAKIGDRVSMNYTGRFENGVIFDSNVDPKFQHVEPFVFTLGAGQVIPGWDKGIAGMKVGEKKILTIGPEDAYGPSGVPGAIPPNSTLVFDVELVSIIK